MYVHVYLCSLSSFDEIKAAKEPPPSPPSTWWEWSPNHVISGGCRRHTLNWAVCYRQWTGRHLMSQPLDATNNDVLCRPSYGQRLSNKRLPMMTLCVSLAAADCDVAFNYARHLAGGSSRCAQLDWTRQSGAMTAAAQNVAAARGGWRQLINH